MSEETIKIGTVLSVDDAKRSINDLRTSIDGSRAALKGLNEGTKEYNDTLNKLLDDQATLAKIINELPTTTKTVTDRFDAMQKSVQGMTSGFQALQGIMQLTNTENQNVINSLHKMMAVQQVVQGINGFIAAIRGSTVAMRIFNMVVKSNPLMLLISAIAATVAAFSTLKLSIGETERDLRSLEDRVVDIKIKYSDGGYSSDIDKQLTDKAKRIESEKALKNAKDELQEFLKTYNKTLDDVDKIGTVISQNQTKLFKGLNKTVKRELASRLIDIYQLQNEYYAEDLKAKQQQMEEEIDLNAKRMESEGATEESIFKMKQEYRNKFMAERKDELNELNKIQKLINADVTKVIAEDPVRIANEAANFKNLATVAEWFGDNLGMAGKSLESFLISFYKLSDYGKDLVGKTSTEIADEWDDFISSVIMNSEIYNRVQADTLNISAENQAIYHEVKKKNEKEAAEYAIKVAKDLFDAKIKQQEEYHKEALKSSEEYRRENEKLLADYARTEADLENQAAIDKRAKEEEALETNLQKIEYYNNKKLELTEELKQKEAEANLLGPVSEDDSNLILGEKIRINKELLEIRRQLAGEEASLFQEEKIRDEERKNMLMERVELQNNLNEQLANIKEGQEEQRAKEDEQKLKDMEDHRNSLDILLNETLAKLNMKDLEIEKEQELLEVYADLTNQRINIDNKYAQTKQKLEQKKQAIEQSGFRSTSTILKSAGSLLSEHTAGYKALAIASTTIDTYAAAQAAYKHMVPIGGPIAGGLAAAAAVASGIQNIMAIKSTEVKGASSSNDGGSVNVPLTIEPIDVQENFTKLDSDDLDIINNTNQRVYVVESDITETQNRVKVNEAEATF